MRILKNHFFSSENIPPQMGYSASFGILWTHIDKFFWPKIGFQNLNFFLHYKQGYFPLFHKTLRLITNLLSINQIFGMQLLSHQTQRIPKKQLPQAFLIKWGHPIVQSSNSPLLCCKIQYSMSIRFFTVPYCIKHYCTLQ